MAVTKRAARAPRAGLRKEAVLRAGIAIADRRGLDALTMRELGAALGVEAMSLYHYVRDKEELLDGMIDLVVGEFEPPPSGVEWKAALRRSALSAYRILTEHRWAAGLVMSRGPADARPRWMEAILRTLRTAGFAPDVTDHAYHALDSHIIGFTLWQASLRLGGPDLADRARAFFARTGATGFPYLREHMEQHMKPRRPGSDFEFGLDLILDGLERLGGARRRPRRRPVGP